MADKAISDLTQALQITNEDLFVLEQNGEAKKLKGSQVVQYAKDAVAAEVHGVKEYADTAKASADAAAKDATRAETAAQGIDDKVAAADASAKAAASSAAAAAASATGVDEKVQAAQTAATNAAKSETAAKAAQTAAANAQKAAESAQTGAQAAKTAAESAQEAAESAKDAAAGSSTSAGQKAAQAAQSAEDAASAKSAAETAKTDAQAARDAITNMMVEAITLETGEPATVSKSLVDNVYKLVFGLPRGETGDPGPKGATGNGISGIALKSGTHAPGTSDVYTITLTDGTTFDFAVYNGANGQGAGDMLASVYDPQGKRTDVFKYVDDTAVHKTGDEDVSGVKTFNAPVKIPNTEQITTKFKTPNGGAVIVGTEAANNGTMLRFDQVDGTTRLRFRASAAPGAMIWEQPEQGAKLYIDLGEHGIDYRRIMFPMIGGGTLAFQSSVDAKVPNSRKINGHALSANIDLTASDVGALPGTTLIPSVPTTTAILKGDGSGGAAAAISGTDYASPAIMHKVTLTVAGWNSNTKQQTVTCAGILADKTNQRVICAAVDESYDSAWNACYVQCVGRAADSLTFQCDEIPTVAVEVFVTIEPVAFTS